MIFFICLITSWLEIGNGKEYYFQYNLNIHILSQFSTTLKKDFEKERWSTKNLPTLVCFHPTNFINKSFTHIKNKFTTWKNQENDEKNASSWTHVNQTLSKEKKIKHLNL